MSRPRAFSRRSSRISDGPLLICARSSRWRSSWLSNIWILPASSAIVLWSWTGEVSSTVHGVTRWMRPRLRRRWRSEGVRVQEAAAQDNVFAANRAAGRIALAVAAQSGVTRRRQVYEDGPLRVRFPNSSGPALEAMIVNTAGGIAGGDRHDLDIEVGEGATLAVTTAAAEKVYRALGPAAGLGARLAFVARAGWP